MPNALVIPFSAIFTESVVSARAALFKQRLLAKHNLSPFLEEKEAESMSKFEGSSSWANKFVITNGWRTSKSHKNKSNVDAVNNNDAGGGDDLSQEPQQQEQPQPEESTAAPSILDLRSKIQRYDVDNIYHMERTDNLEDMKRFFKGWVSIEDDQFRDEALADEVTDLMLCDLRAIEKAEEEANRIANGEDENADDVDAKKEEEEKPNMSPEVVNEMYLKLKTIAMELSVYGEEYAGLASTIDQTSDSLVDVYRTLDGGKVVKKRKKRDSSEEVEAREESAYDNEAVEETPPENADNSLMEV